MMDYFKLRDIKRTFLGSDSQMASVGNDADYALRMDEFARAERSLVENKFILEQLKLPKNSKLLDFGCNTGRFLETAREKYQVEAFGVDINAEAVQRAKELFPSLNVQLIHSHKLPFENNQFDAITLNHVIGHLPNLDAYLHELNRVLRPGGKIAIMTPNKWYKVSLSLNNFFNSYRPDPTVLRYFTTGTLKKAISAAGFKVLECDTFGGFPNAELEKLNLKATRFRIYLIAEKKA